MTNLEDAIGLLRSLIERGHECATYQEDEMCFYCGVQINYSAPKRLADHNDDCLFVHMVRTVEAYERESAQ